MAISFDWELYTDFVDKAMDTCFETVYFRNDPDEYLDACENIQNDEWVRGSQPFAYSTGTNDLYDWNTREIIGTVDEGEGVLELDGVQYQMEYNSDRTLIWNDTQEVENPIYSFNHDDDVCKWFMFEVDVAESLLNHIDDHSDHEWMYVIDDDGGSPPQGALRCILDLTDQKEYTRPDYNKGCRDFVFVDENIIEINSGHHIVLDEINQPQDPFDEGDIQAYLIPDWVLINAVEGGDDPEPEPEYDPEDIYKKMDEIGEGYLFFDADNKKISYVLDTMKRNLYDASGQLVGTHSKIFRT